jgi:hypothetical protein
MPRKRSGYRAERIPKKAGEKPVVVWERPPEANYEKETDDESAFKPSVDEATWVAQQTQETEEILRQKKAAEKLAYDLLIDESKWREW